ncbi:HisA/HisF-related TIM barrel protein [Bacillus cereus]
MLEKVAEGKWNVYVNGGRVDTGMDAIEWAKRVVKLGAGEILCNEYGCRWNEKRI